LSVANLSFGVFTVGGLQITTEVFADSCSSYEAPVKIVRSFQWMRSRSRTHKRDNFCHMQQLDAGKARGVDGQAREPWLRQQPINQQ